MANYEMNQTTTDYLKNGELNETELALLNNLMYIKSITSSDYEGKPLGDFINRIRKKGLDKLDDPNDNFDFTAKEWDKILSTVEKDEKLANLTIKYPHEDEFGGQQICLVNNSGQATAVFRGTGSKEWPDNFKGAYQTDTDLQSNALDWFNSLPYNNVTVTGHSKGGNKAQYVTIKSDKVSKCVAFDGQGFSKEFCEKYQNEIANNKNKITLIAPSDDYVNILLFRIAGKTIYTQPEKSMWDKLKDEDIDEILREHCPDRMLQFNKDGTVSLRNQVEQEPIMAFLHEFTLYIEKNASYEDKQALFNFMGASITREKERGDGWIDWIDSKVSTGYYAIEAYEVFTKYLKPFAKPLIGSAETEKLCKILFNYYASKEMSPTDSTMLKLIFADMASKMKSATLPCLSSTLIRDNIEPSTKALEGKIRDFSKEVQDELKSLVKEVEDESFFNFTKWDVWYRIEDSQGKLNIEEYHDDINTYYKKLIDINGTSLTEIDNIFQQVKNIDCESASQINQHCEKLKDIKRNLDRLSEGIDTRKIEVR
ncbi:DUF2974 domain-containing protein [Clostridium sp. SHJSY1]|uniref:Mbeg1-like protein n=1 Tax=Clostridium sp. SHJSY1 TaxID=2942483 RepID=UPI002876BEB6|nr:Mbeg1-like protein [Clostridium sp. SHJSY1]MDS0525622.1 DUF2974 domain-containing protein [Clostridium sp. SHJSY1]